jgi:ribonuclease P protein component
MSARLGRIIRSEDFSDILRNGARVSRSGIGVVFQPSPQGPRLGFAIGKPAGNAVQRNRMRRVIRELLRHSVLPNVDVVVTMRGAIRDLSNNDIRASIQSILEKNGWLS